MDPATTPGNLPRRGLAIALSGACVASVLTIAAVIGTSSQASASGLEAFNSCEELSAWGTEQVERSMETAMPTSTFSVAAGSADAESTGAGGTQRLTSSATAAEESADSSTGGTNVVVEGVDELDLVELLSGDRGLFVSPTALVLVDLDAGERVARTGVTWGAQVTYDADAQVAWVVGSSDDGLSVEVRRIAVGASELTDQGSWSTSGQLVTARRLGGELHVVATAGFTGVATDPIPFEGGPVPCDRVLHPAGPSDASATLIATLPVSGALEPTDATEVVGSGQLVHLTPNAAYLATPQWDPEGETTTTVHRFELDDLTHTGSGQVPGTLLNDFSMSEHDGHLRVAVTAGAGGGFIGGPMPMMPIEGDSGMGDVAVESSGAIEPGSPGRAVPGPTVVEAVPPPVDPEVPETTVPETTVPETTVPETTVPETTVPETTVPETTTTTGAPGAVEQPGPDDPLNRVLVLDTEGDLDTVGTTPWFGLPGETLHGIRFDGATAYAVTFLQTDPFYVIDLANPTAPRIAGEVKLPGFSSYLHPVGDDAVVGFGPGEDGRSAAKLFDVSDPAAPKVVDTVVLGDDAPISYDHHAFTDLGDGRFATPVTTWSNFGGGCILPEGTPEGPTIDLACAPEPVDPAAEPGVESSVVELRVEGNQLIEVSRTSTRLAEPASRAIPTSDGWALLAGTAVAFIDDAGALRTSVDLS